MCVCVCVYSIYVCMCVCVCVCDIIGQYMVVQVSLGQDSGAAGKAENLLQY